ncbi:Kelch_1 domain-containing protein [Cephalotus follicularis]|uniref:Kelch_1 domain-containing protein n=1 Tax=Cephalotus follicularis TaxID=3775 RepID=A0A1Q3D0W8_CEPFO|nr:Kelch_1 domain-containing protein [Cephalotus follicularis]
MSRIHYSTHRVASRVCKRWRDLLRSRDFYYLRKQTKKTHKAACLVQSLPAQTGADGKPVRSQSYGVSVYDPVSGTWNRVEPVPKYPDGLPFFCQVTSSEGKIVVMGGWDPASYDPVCHVFVYEFTTRRWRQGKDMPRNMSFFASGELNGRIIVAGGHDESKNALNSAWMYDVDRDEWTELTRMSQERDECEGVVIGSQFMVVSGYKTESQGGFEGSAELYELGTGEWRRVEDTWRVGECPRGCAGLGKEGKLFCWGEFDSGIRVGTCGVQGGEWTFVCGSSYQGGPQGFYLVEGQNSKLKRIDVPNEFSGFVQSGCCVEI